MFSRIKIKLDLLWTAFLGLSRWGRCLRRGLVCGHRGEGTLVSGGRPARGGIHRGHHPGQELWSTVRNINIDLQSLQIFVVIRSMTKWEINQLSKQMKFVFAVMTLFHRILWPSVMILVNGRWCTMAMLNGWSDLFILMIDTVHYAINACLMFHGYDTKARLYSVINWMNLTL